MSELYIHDVKNIKITETRFPKFTDFRVLIETRDETFEITLFPDDDTGIGLFKELDEIIVDLEAHPDVLESCIEKLKNLIPLKRKK